jgi:prephenate dehydratase
VVILPQCAAVPEEARHPRQGQQRQRPRRARGGRGGRQAEGRAGQRAGGGDLRLDVLARHIEDHKNNTTRFLVMSRDPDHPPGRAR